MDAVYLIPRLFLSLFLFLLCHSASSITPTYKHPSYEYWVRSNITTPIPDPIKSGLSSGTVFTNLAETAHPNGFIYSTSFGYEVTGENKTRNSISKEMMSLFFLKDTISTRRGTIKLGFTTEGLKYKFIPRNIESKFPFSNTHLKQLLNMTSVDPNSHMATLKKETIMECHAKPLKGEIVKCIRNLEDMTDMVSEMGAREVGWNNATGNMGMQTFYYYTVVNQFGVTGKPIIACHKMAYPYAVYYCHSDGTSIGYTFILSSKNNIILHTVAVCHLNTAYWES